MAAVDRTVEAARAVRKSQGHKLGPFNRKVIPWEATCRECGGSVVIKTWRSPWGLSAYSEGLDGPCPGKATE